MLQDFKKGIFLEKPNVLIPWNIKPYKLNKLLGQHNLKKVTSSYYCIKTTFLNGLDCTIGFHFYFFGIKFFEIFRSEDYYKNHTLLDSYNEFQKHIELAFGKPSLTRKSTNPDFDVGFDSHTWKVGKRKVLHYVFERFGPEEHFHIER